MCDLPKNNVCLLISNVQFDILQLYKDTLKGKNT